MVSLWGLEVIDAGGTGAVGTGWGTRSLGPSTGNGGPRTGGAACAASGQRTVAFRVTVAAEVEASPE